MAVKKKHRDNIVTLVASLPDGTHIVEHANGKLERRKSETDWARVDALTDKDIEEAVGNDPDAVPPDFNWNEAVFVIPPKKKPISIRVDEDVLDYFKQEGAGYQRRMNAVLRSYMQQKKSKKKRA
ncbi:MAG TPA: BrnA antitoxin family protein [Pseudolabrys sp.]|nr:BrnA antitoxin family protein [Pseudolabrys sp.]